MVKFETMSIAEINFKEAIAKGELVEYLGGYPAYLIEERYADMPTDYGAAFSPLAKRMKDDPKLQESVLAAIKTLADDPEYGWGAIFHITNLVSLRRNTGLDLLTPSFVETVANTLRKNKDAFKSLRRWIGKDFDDGVWRMVLVENKILHTKHNITVLPEEL